MAGDSRRRIMHFKTFSNLRFQLSLLLMLLTCSLVSAAETAKKAEAGKDQPPAAEETAAGEKSEPASKEDKDVESGTPAEENAADKAESDKDSDKAEIDPDDEAAVEEAETAVAAVARPVSPDPIQVYGWKEKILIDGLESDMTAKLDTGAYTSSIHAEETELFERDGKKWVRFIVTEPRKKGSPRVRMEAPLVRIARIKEPGGESETREVVRLAFKIGGRKLRGDFTLNNRANMLSAVLIGRTTIKELGWIDPSRVYLADDKIMR
ncbi:ATP-dependent zinc protease [Luteolibacter algae]|uniref:ATP-dependent zinc protease n=1 Tax=Luteolibacter algae TaxID=454151 RepID=A0ABW5D636_9BACT